MARWHNLGLIVALLSISAGAMQALQSQNYQMISWHSLETMPGSLNCAYWTHA